MEVSEIVVRMIEYSKGNLHDISHFLKVYAYAAAIARQEHLSPDAQKTVEIAAVLHDIACPLCRLRYGNTNGKAQEKEGMILAREFLEPMDMPQEMKNRIVYLVGHHHTYTDVDGMDYQILLEADYLVNADESGYSRQNIQNMEKVLFKTRTGRELLHSIYLADHS